MFTADQAAAGFFWTTCLFKKARFGLPKPCLRLNRRPQALFLFEKRCAFLEKVCFRQDLLNVGQYLLIFVKYLLISVNICQYRKAQSFCVTKLCFEASSAGDTFKRSTRQSFKEPVEQRRIVQVTGGVKETGNCTTNRKHISKCKPLLMTVTTMCR